MMSEAPQKASGRRRGVSRFPVAEPQWVPRAMIAVLAVLCVHCQREASPQASSAQPSDAGPPATATASASPPASAPSLVPEARAPAPVLAPGKQLAWQIEQYGRPVAATAHTVELARAPFTLVFHLRAGIHDLFVNASYKSHTFDAARLGWQFLALTGIQGASRVDQPPEANNRLRDIFVNDDAPNQWIVCPPGAACSGFDEPCEATAEGVVCRRTIEHGRSQRDFTSTTEKRLSLVFVVPGQWSEDERDGKLSYQTQERARDWGMIVWKSPP